MEDNELYKAVSNNELEFVESYFTRNDLSDGMPRAGGSDAEEHTKDRKKEASLILTAVRNGHVEMIRLLERYGETILDEEAEEYISKIEPLYERYYKDTVESLRGKPLHLELEYDEKSISSLCKVTCQEYPEFEYVGKWVTGKIGYYALCEWVMRSYKM